MRTHMEARHNSSTSRKRNELLAFSLLNDEINEMRDRLEKLAAKNTEGT